MKKLLIAFSLFCISMTIYAEALIEGQWEQRIEGIETGSQYIEVTTLELNEDGTFKKTINFDDNFADYLEIIYGKYEIKDGLCIETYEKYECFKNGEKEEETVYAPAVTYESSITILSDNFLQIEFQDEDGEIDIERYRRMKKD